MATTINNHVFKGHRTLLGSKFVTYGELELPIRYEFYPKSNSGFDWGNQSKGANQLSFSILCQLSNPQIAEQYTEQYTQEIVKHLNSRDWILKASEVLKWLEQNGALKKEPKPLPKDSSSKQQKSSSATKKTNIVREICQELQITQKQLAEILEVPEGTVSSWAVKNEIPRLGKKAIEFYTQNQKNQKIVESYKNFVNLLQEK